MENRKPRLAVLASRFPFPVEKGDKLRLYYQLKQLSLDFDIYLFALVDEPVEPQDRQEVEQYCARLFVYRDQRMFRKWRVVTYWKDKWPAQVRYFYSPLIHRIFLKDFFRINADIIYCQLYRMAPYLQGIRAPKVLDVMDNFASIATLHADYSRKFYNRLFWRREYRLITRYERRILSQFDHITVISERDAETLGMRDDKRISIIRNGINVPFFQTYPHREASTKYDFGFIGNMEYKPNIEAVRYLTEQIIPEFRRHGTQVRILIGGKGAENLKHLGRDYPELTFHGWYDDIREAYYSVRMIVVPLFLGSGMQNKVLEALACSLPVICTSHVINGMPMLQEFVHIADRPDEFWNCYNTLVQQPIQTPEQSGILSVLKNELTWEAQCAKLKQVLDDTGKSYAWDFARYH